ncbi:hypothetical protein B0H14DRAFT_3441859 [Mycena olivaceomarginata]|nr:hypothetical protein B0H14DRAFT_3441859 [Mycena olivaceomarginata]
MGNAEHRQLRHAKIGKHQQYFAAPPLPVEGWQLQPLAAPDLSTNLFDMSQELPILPPSETQGERGANAMTSTPYRHKGKGKGQELAMEPLLLAHPDDFYAQEKTPRLAAHDCSNSFSFGNTMFYSLAHGERSPRMLLKMDFFRIQVFFGSGFWLCI